MSLNKRVGFIGAGQVAEALARGFVARGVVTVSAITATDPVAARKEVFKSFGANVTGSNAEVRSMRSLLAMEKGRKRRRRGRKRGEREGSIELTVFVVDAGRKKKTQPPLPLLSLSHLKNRSCKTPTSSSSP